MTQIQGLIVGYSTEGEVKGCHVVCHGEEVGSVKQATAATDKLLGVSTRVTTNATEHTDVVRSGLAPVTYGDTVKRGEQIGLSGATGLATGPHLHWEVRLLGQAVNPDLFVQYFPN